MRQALELALEALETPRPFDSYPPLWRAYEKTINEAITAIKEALAQPKQEPVAWEQFYPDIGKPQLTHPPQGIYYTTPQQRKPLTDEEIESLADSLEVWNDDSEKWILDSNTFARAIEAAHGIKGEV